MLPLLNRYAYASNNFSIEAIRLLKVVLEINMNAKKNHIHFSFLLHKVVLSIILFPCQSR